MIKFLSSLKMAAILLVSLIVVFLIGVVITSEDGVYNAFKQMNDVIILDWLRDVGNKNTIVVIWFIVLCTIAVLFGINLFLCTKDRLMKYAFSAKTLKSIVLLVIHTVFIIILFLHAISLIIGFKYGNIVLNQGESFEFENGYTVSLDSIHFVDDLSLLKDKKKSSRLELTREKFHYRENYASLVLYKDGKKLIADNAYIFSPIFNNGIQLTVEKFIFDKQSSMPAIKITITKNPLVWFFFVFYGLGILSLVAYLFLRDKNG